MDRDLKLRAMLEEFFQGDQERMTKDLEICLWYPTMREMANEAVRILLAANREEADMMFIGGGLNTIETLLWAMQEAASADPVQRERWKDFRLCWTRRRRRR